MRYVNCVVLSILALFFPMAVLAGSLDSPAAPTSATSAMYTLEDIYNRLNNNTQATKRSGAFTEPSAAPGSTGHTLDQVYEKAIPTQVPKTGQTTSTKTGDDGDLEKGVAWPTTRFTDNGDGTVTDNLTGLIWLKNANCFGLEQWSDALSACNSLADGTCSLTDSSSAGDWRLPNIKEILSLIDYGQFDPALASNPFTGVKSGPADRYYWSNTMSQNASDYKWAVQMYNGYVTTKINGDTHYVWPVRGGQ
jgi:hypothetical protein